MQIASVDNKKVEVNLFQAAAVAFAVGAGAVAATSLADFLLGLAKAGTEAQKLALDHRKASAELYRAALAVSDAEKRKTVVRFLFTAKLVDPNPAVEEMTEFPHWPGE